MTTPVDLSKIDPRSVYEYAGHFLFTEWYLRRQIDNDPSLAGAVSFPGMIVSAFASELYFKCLIYLDGRKPPNDHHLGKLFNKLSQTDRSLVQGEWDRMIVATEDQTKRLEIENNFSIPRDMDTALNECGDAFRLLRYVYEGHKALFYITHLPLVLKKVIQTKTNWP